MQTVKRSWLSVLNKIFLALDILYFVAFFAHIYLNTSDASAQFWGLQPVIATMVSVHFLYGVFIYERVSRANLWLAALLGNILSGLVFSTAIEVSGGANYYYRLGFALYVFLIGMGGIFTPIAAIGITWVLYFFVLIDALKQTPESLFVYALINIFITASGILSWLFFKRYYVRSDTKEVARLSGLLKQEQFKANLILESITDGVIVVNTKGTIQVLNQAAATMLGWTREDALKLDYKAVVQTTEPSETQTGKSKTTNVIEQTLQQHTPSHSIVQLKTRSGRALFVDIVASPINEATGPQHTKKSEDQPTLVGVIAVLRDVDQQKKQEQQRSDFVSTASHEMRTPVASIQGFIELALNKKVATIDDKARGYLKKAFESTQHLSDLFQDLLTVSKSDDGRLSNQPQIIEVNQLLSEIVEQDSVMAKEKNLKVIYENGAKENKNIAPLMYANVDPDRLREIVSNLFENAVKYTDEGMITVGVSLNDPNIVIRVSDTGLGIAQEDIPHLFQKFYRTDNTKTRAIGGTGLGLYISRQIAQSMGGTIWVESTVGKGSTFFVQIPRVNPSDIPAANSTP